MNGLLDESHIRFRNCSDKNKSLSKMVGLLDEKIKFCFLNWSDYWIIGWIAKWSYYLSWLTFSSENEFFLKCLDEWMNGLLDDCQIRFRNCCDKNKSLSKVVGLLDE